MVGETPKQEEDPFPIPKNEGTARRDLFEGTQESGNKPTDLEIETATPEDQKRFKELEAQGFVDHFFDDNAEEHQEKIDTFIANANKNGWKIEIINKGRYIHIFTKES